MLIRKRVYCIVISMGTTNKLSKKMVFDITEIYYRVVAKFRDNEIKPADFQLK